MSRAADLQEDLRSMRTEITAAFVAINARLDALSSRIDTLVESMSRIKGN